MATNLKKQRSKLASKKFFSLFAVTYFEPHLFPPHTYSIVPHIFRNKYYSPVRTGTLFPCNFFFSCLNLNITDFQLMFPSFHLCFIAADNPNNSDVLRETRAWRPFWCIRRAQVKVRLRLERRYSQRQNFAISPVDGSVCHEKFGIHSIAAVCCWLKQKRDNS